MSNANCCLSTDNGFPLPRAEITTGSALNTSLTWMAHANLILSDLRSWLEFGWETIKEDLKTQGATVSGV